ncbi:hypothetical protein F5146DRAFT_1001333 [Armillaria mellea]|nr:hypothetical protein F5146DRAFT_1001333 [Armillaria mellea]
MSLPPILWPDSVRGIDNWFLFRSETLMKLSKFEGRQSHQEEINEQKLWGMNKVTPGAIAFTAIMAHFVLSGDIHFNEHGAHSHIHYAADFKLYKSTIIKYLNKCHMKDTDTAFNQFVFKDQGLDHNSHPSNVAVEELVDSVGAVTLAESNAMNEVEHPVADEIGTGHSWENKWQGQSKA